MYMAEDKRERRYLKPLKTVCAKCGAHPRYPRSSYCTICKLEAQKILKRKNKGGLLKLPSLEGEVWIPIENFEGFYEVSNYSRIKSIERINNYGRLVREREMKPINSGIGYLNVILHKNGEITKFKLHRLVAIAFIPNPNKKPFINHKDGNPLNNDINNLEWCNQSENVIHAFDSGLNTFYGEKHPNAKLSKKQVLEIVNSKQTSTALAKKYKVALSTISNIRTGKQWSRITGIKYIKKVYNEKKAS